MNEYERGRREAIEECVAEVEGVRRHLLADDRDEGAQAALAIRCLIRALLPVEPKPKAARDENPAVIAARELARRDAAGPADGGEAEGYVGPCVHGRDPYDRCDGCFDLTPKQAQAVAYAEDFRYAPIPTDEALAAMTKEIAEWKLVVKKALGIAQ